MLFRSKFRGDQAVLDPGLDELTRRTGLRNYGVLPWLADVWLDGEDALTIGSRALRPGTGVLLRRMFIQKKLPFFGNLIIPRYHLSFSPASVCAIR